MAWYDEIPALCRCRMSEIGFVFFVRNIMRNKLVTDEYDLRQKLGPEWQTALSTMSNARFLSVQYEGKKITVSVVAPGDKKRERCKRIGKRKRLFDSFEEKILKEKL